MYVYVYVDMSELAEQVECYLGMGCRVAWEERLRGRSRRVRPE